jgi:amino acid adenylation domain-containing protein
VHEERLDQRLSRLAAERPDQPAAVGDDGRLTLGQLDERAGALAVRVRAAVAGPGARVAVLVERGAGTVTAAYAVWRAGCVYVPLDAAWPRARVTAVLRAAAVHAVVEGRGDELTVTAVTDGAPLSDDRLAYIIHTSGTTGTPKGVPISHEAIGALVRSHQRLIYQPEGVDGGAAALVASTAFDSSVERLALAAYGHAVHVPGPAMRLDPDALAGYLGKHGIVSADFVPSQLRVLLRAGLLDRAPALRLLIVGGERFDADLWEAVAASGVSAYNVYGPTENTVNTTIAKVTAGQRPVIGRPLPGVLCTVVGPDGRPVPVGEAGELVIGGIQLSPGYLGDPALSARAFRDLDGERRYWTGDLVRVTDQAGTLEFLGRADDQVKINGNRIEPADIRHHLCLLPGVGDAEVTPVDTPTGQKLLASVVPAGAGSPGLDVLRARLAEALPAAMVPAYWMELPALPLTANLKRDHDALRDQWRATSQAAEPGEDGTEEDTGELVRRIFSEVLGTQVTDRSAHFFAIGGDSVAVMELIVRVKAATGAELGLADIVKNPTIDKLTGLLTAPASAGPA